VLGHVGERLLGDAVEHGLELGREPVGQAEVEVDGDPGVLLEALGMLAQGLGEAPVVEHGRPQGAHQAAQHPGLLAEPLLDPLQDLVGPWSSRISPSAASRPRTSLSRLRAR
jgi:hypothetical protein